MSQDQKARLRAKVNVHRAVGVLAHPLGRPAAESATSAAVRLEIFDVRSDDEDF